MNSGSELPPLSERVPYQELPKLPTDLGLTWRALVREDARKLSDLISLIEVNDDSPFRTSFEETVELFDGDWKNLSSDTIVAVSEAGEFLAYGLLHMPPGDNTMTRVLMDGGVHPSVREIGIGQAVVAWLSARAHNMLREKNTGLPGRIASYLQDNAQHNWELFEEAGFKPRRFYKSLRRDLSRPIDSVQLAPQLKLEHFTMELDDAVREAHNDAFRDHWGSQPHTPESWVQGRAQFRPEWSFVVVDEDNLDSFGAPVVAGYVLVNKYEQDWEAFGFSSGYIDMLGVRRDYRGQKIALALLARAMQTLAEDNIEFAELDVDSENPSGALGMYTHLGFEVSSGSRMYSLEF